MTRRSLAFAAGLLAVAAGASAQVDSTKRDTTARDTTPALLPSFAAPIAPGPLPLGTRYTFTADSLAFSSIQTLSDLLGHIPGVYVARGGLYGAAEIVLYGGRGPAGLEVYWDGVPYLPIGRDSVYLDPARVPLAPLERVEVIVLPATLRVYLVTARQQSTATATEVRILTGEVSSAGYRGAFSRRWRSGLGLSLLADWNTRDAIAASSSTSFSDVDLWLKAEYVPAPTRGVSYEILSSAWNRGSGFDVDPLKRRRRDGIFRLFVAGRLDGLGPRLQFTLATATADQDTAVSKRSVSQGILELSQTWPHAHAGLAARLQDAPRPSQLEGRIAWNPVRLVTIAADARHATYRGSRSGDRAHLAAGLELPFGFSAHGDVAWARDLQAPALDDDSTQRTTDLYGAVRWERRWVTAELGGARRDPFAPLGFPGGLKPIGTFSASPSANYVTMSASVRPLPGLQLSGWYFNPVAGRNADFELPYHARVSATFFSKFWRVYRSGIFALRGEIAAESWSAGVGGRDTLGSAPLFLAGATFVETNVELQVAGVTVFWIIRNNNRMRAGYVPLLDYPRRFQVYGVRWVFTN